MIKKVNLMLELDDATRLRKYIETLLQNGEQRLPPEPKLSEVIGCSRGRLRTLLKYLEDEGVIWRHVGKGTFIGPKQVSAGDDTIATEISVDGIIGARLALEPQLASYAAIYATPADIVLLDQCLQGMARAETFTEWRRLDEKLHRSIALATHNVLLLMLYDTLHTQVKDILEDRFQEIFGNLSGPKETTDGEHKAIVDAIRGHNVTLAEQSMRLHLQSVRNHIFGLR